MTVNEETEQKSIDRLEPGTWSSCQHLRTFDSFIVSIFYIFFYLSFTAKLFVMSDLESVMNRVYFKRCCGQNNDLIPMMEEVFRSFKSINSTILVL